MRIPLRLIKILNPAKQLLGSRTTLASLPTEILCEICSYITPQDHRNLRLVSKNILLKLPPPRFTNITISFADIGFAEVERLAQIPLQQRREVVHLILDFTPPGLCIIDKEDLNKLRQKYSDEVRQGIADFCRNCEDRTRLPSGSEISTTTSSPEPTSAVVKTATKNPFRKLAVKMNTHRLADETNTDLHSTLAHNLPSILPAAEQSVQTISQTLKQDYSKHLVGIFNLLPNIYVLEFRDHLLPLSNQRNKPYLRRIWEKTNPSLSTFLTNNPELRNLPWQDWFHPPDHGKLDQISSAYPAVIVSAIYASAKSSKPKSRDEKISQIRWNGKIWSNYGHQLPNWLFTGFEIPPERGSEGLCGITAINHITEFEYIYGGDNQVSSADICKAVRELFDRCNGNYYGLKEGLELC